MRRYWLITEPARGTSLRIDIDGDAEAALEAWAAEHDADMLADWKAFCDECEEGQWPDKFSIYFADASGDDVQLVEER
jgi:hypothetical protein